MHFDHAVIQEFEYLIGRGLPVLSHQAQLVTNFWGLGLCASKTQVLLPATLLSALLKCLLKCFWGNNFHPLTILALCRPVGLTCYYPNSQLCSDSPLTNK